MFPDFLTHYYLRDSEPFLSISDLSSAGWLELESRLATRREEDPSYHRRFGKFYQSVRLQTEAILYEKFKAKGGKPERQHPHYLCLGKCDWWLKFCDHVEIRIPLSEIDPSVLSFTYPDSFTSMGVLSRFGIEHPKHPYHGEVFTLDEIQQVVSEYGMPIGGESSDYSAYHKDDLELYIEAQLWSDPCITPPAECSREQRL